MAKTHDKLLKKNDKKSGFRSGNPAIKTQKKRYKIIFHDPITKENMKTDNLESLAEQKCSNGFK